jgi:hypothetical protein
MPIIQRLIYSLIDALEALARWHRHRCDECWRSFDKTRVAPMLREATWQKIARPDEALCGRCMFQRARECKVEITFADLLPSPFNLDGTPNSWFDRLLQKEAAQPDLSEWRCIVKAMGPKARAESIIRGRVPDVLREAS